MASAHAAAHDQGIVHRDLKPDNVFLHVPAGRALEEPIVKLLDFGIAKLHRGPEAGSKTRTGQLLGTPMYMSPEQCRGARQVDSRSDIYSFGCIMFEMFCGRPPFMAEGFGELIHLHISEAPPDPHWFSPGLSGPVRALLLRCLEKAPESRPASMTEVSALLAHVGAPDVLHLHAPVVRGRNDSPGARSPAGWAFSPPPAVTPLGRVPSRRPLTPAVAATPGTMLLPQNEPARPPTLAPTTLSGGAAELRGGRKGGGLKIALLGAGFAGAAVVAVLLLRGKGTGALPADDVGARPAAVHAAQDRAVQDRAVRVDDEPADPAPRPAERTSASIKLTGLPDGATVRLDGRPARPPFVVSRGPHRLAVEAEGYEPWEQSVDATSDQTVAVHLKAQAATAAAPSKAKHKNEHHKDPSHFNGFSDLY
jgi:serine/threonine-protein kinase